MLFTQNTRCILYKNVCLKNKDCFSPFSLYSLTYDLSRPFAKFKVFFYWVGSFAMAFRAAAPTGGSYGIRKAAAQRATARILSLP